MGRIEVGRYDDPTAVGFSGWIRPETDGDHKVPEWVIFVDDDGRVVLSTRNEKDELVF